MSRGRQPTAQQLAEERQVTLLAATDARISWDEYERQLLVYLERNVAGNPKLHALAKRLQRGNAIEDADHIELYETVRQVSA